MEMNVRYFVGDRQTAELIAQCERSRVNAALIYSQLLEDIKSRCIAHEALGGYDKIRVSSTT